MLEEEEPLVALEAGVTPKLAELRLHQGTVWHWNRPVFDGTDEGHLRIEMRALPAGPTVTDMVANAAFLIGLTLALAPREAELRRAISFEQAQANFYRAAQDGLGARLTWFNERGQTEERAAGELVRNLLPLAAEGLRASGVEESEVNGMLAVLDRRVVTGQTGSSWQLATLGALERTAARDVALERLVERYLALSLTGVPVHEWPVEGG